MHWPHVYIAHQSPLSPPLSYFRPRLSQCRMLECVWFRCIRISHRRMRAQRASASMPRWLVGRLTTVYGKWDHVVDDMSNNHKQTSFF